MTIFFNNTLGTVNNTVSDHLTVVKTKEDLLPPLRSDVAYLIDGVIDMGSTPVEVPAGGITFLGHSFDVSGLISSADNYTMFTSPVGGSGNVLGADYFMQVTGANSKVFNLVSTSGFEAFEFARINFMNCTSLGEITNYRQGLETGTGRFGGTPTITLAGTWLGGYRIDTCIVRNLASNMNTPLFKAGVNLLITSRFVSDHNVDLPANASYLDFSEANFTNPSTLQLRNCLISRQGIFNAADNNITPNITRSSIYSSWRDNIGLPNTFEGVYAKISSEVATVVSATNTWYDVNGTWSFSDQQHFSETGNNQPVHIGDSPREFKVSGDLTIVSTANDVVELRILRWDTFLNDFVEEVKQRRQVNSLVGSRDVAFFTLIGNVTLDKNEFIKLQVRNDTSVSNITVEIDSYFILEKR